MRFVLSEELEEGMMIAREIIMGKHSTMLRKGTVLTPTIIHRLQIGGYFGVYVNDSFSQDVVYGESIDPELFQKGVEAVEEEDVGALVNVASSIVDEISDQDKLGLDLYDLRSYDNYTYHHSVNVAVYSVVVGKKMGLSKEELSDLCMAAISHDLGKTEVDPEIINKKGSLTDEEFAEIKKHPQYSYDILYKRNDVPATVRQAVLCHHENENGSGYPLGLVKDDIPLMAKIIHGVDVYDALTSKRSYKEPYSPAEAFEYLKGGAGILFDENVVTAMEAAIPIYPPGTDVVLSNGEKALVVAHTSDNYRPIVKLYSNSKLVNLKLSKDYQFVVIVKSGPNLVETTGAVDILNDKRGVAALVRDRIIVVDDSSMILMSVKKMLQDKYDIITFGSAIEALNYMRDHGFPELVIMDIEMPGMNGVEAIRKLKGMDYKGPVIVFTVSCDRGTVLECKALGATDYIVKPAQPVYLQERVALALKKYIEV